MNVLKNKIVHCKTEDEAKKLMQIAEDEGYRWVTGAKPTSHTNFSCANTIGVTYFFDNPHKGEVVYGIFITTKTKEEMIEFTDLFTTEDYKGNIKVTKYNTTLGEKILVKDYEDDDWQERYFLTAAHGYVYATATEDGRYPFAWKYGIKKEEE